MAKSMSLLLGSGSPPCWRVMITLQEKKLQGYKRKLLSFEKGEHRSQDVLEINPRGQVAAGSYLAAAFSMADVIVFPNIAYALCFRLSVERYPKLAKYYNLLKDRPSIKASRPPHWPAGSQGYEVLKDL